MTVQMQNPGTLFPSHSPFPDNFLFSKWWDAQLVSGLFIVGNGLDACEWRGV